MVRRHVGFQAQRSVVECDLFEDARIQERFHVLVNGAQGYGWNALPNLLVDQFGRRVLMGVNDRFVDYLTLEGEGQPPFLATTAEVFEGSRAQV